MKADLFTALCWSVTVAAVLYCLITGEGSW